LSGVARRAGQGCAAAMAAAPPPVEEPVGPISTDYCGSWRGGEEIASAVVDIILTNGGTILWQKYLEKKAFIFSEKSVADAVTSNLEMCFVAHDAGEEGLGEVWGLEEEPMPANIDSWARMHLPSMKKVGNAEADEQGAMLRKQRQMRLQSMRSRVSERPKAKGADPRGYRSENRMFPIPDDIMVDDEEDRLRDMKVLEEQRRKEKENKAKQAEKVKEVEQTRVQNLHEQMAKFPHTFDTEGNIIWVEEPKPEKLPKVQETFPYNVKKDPKARALEGTANNSTGFQGTAPVPKAQGKARAKGKAKGKGKADETEFTDTFAKLQHGQPPILDTMAMKPGVVLHSQGRMKQGADQENPNKQMSRKEYVQLAEKEEANSAAYSGAAGGAAAKGPGDESISPQGAGSLLGDSVSQSRGLDPEASVGSLGGRAGELPPLQPGGARMQGAGNSQRMGQAPATPADSPAPPEGKVQTAPQAPPLYGSRSKREAISHLSKPPRYHPPALGGPYVQTGTAQPPIGATMGHGLVHSGSMKESFFFPSTHPELPPSLLRAGSEGALRSKDRSLASLSSVGGGNTPKNTPKGSSKAGLRKQGSRDIGGPDDDEEGEQKDGHILVDKRNPAYRNFISDVNRSLGL